jgi:hypothetical protein
MSIVRSIPARVIVLAALAYGPYRTFSFEGPRGAPAGYDATPRSVEVQQRMRPLIAAALEEKGYVEVPEGGDFLVTHGAGRRESRGTRQLSRRAVALMGETEQETSFLEGSLVIDVYDRTAREQVWHGAATAEISQSGVDPQRLAETVQKIMAAFPPALHAPAPK